MTPTHPIPQSPVVHNYSPDNKPPVPIRPFSNPKLLTPDAAFQTQLSSRLNGTSKENPLQNGQLLASGPPSSRGAASYRKPYLKASRKRPRSKRTWKKLLWVKQRDCENAQRMLSWKTCSYFLDPDNYTDPPTFLSRLQVNPRFRPYEFWPLVADSTVIVQHISAVAIFICSFVGIYQERLSPVSVLGWGSASTVLGWILWDFWVGQAEGLKTATRTATNIDRDGGDSVSGSALTPSYSTSAFTSSRRQSTDSQTIGLGLSLSTSNLSPRKRHSHSRSQTSISSAGVSPTLSHNSTHLSPQGVHPGTTTLYSTPRTHQRLSTIKSAVLIYIALLGLSPILKSLTESTAKDSIWAMSCWLMAINIFFFDYSGGVEGVQFPASLSTNAALMASTVLASRLPSTTHVFSLTLFSIQVFGLFPVFRRHLKHVSWQSHVVLTIALMIAAGTGLGLTLSGVSFWEGGWKRAIAGAFIWALGSIIGMGGCSWWLIGLQRYKNVVIGPWDPARPIISKVNEWD